VKFRSIVFELLHAVILTDTDRYDDYKGYICVTLHCVYSKN